jgi:hypothetical protein
MFWLAIIMADLFIYLIIAMALMSYEDHFEPTEGMTTSGRIAFTAYYLWIIINILFIAWALWKAYRLIKRKYF